MLIADVSCASDAIHRAAYCDVIPHPDLRAVRDEHTGSFTVLYSSGILKSDIKMTRRPVSQPLTLHDRNVVLRWLSVLIGTGSRHPAVLTVSFDQSLDRMLLLSRNHSQCAHLLAIKSQLWCGMGGTSELSAASSQRSPQGTDRRWRGCSAQL